ncbi:MAG: hypothetical protein LBQ31_03785 [Bacteroidales bacterium]|jgi:hypothetical protein|nr:hypothetical protein [Bacteroidales bacterium]
MIVSNKDFAWNINKYFMLAEQKNVVITKGKKRFVLLPLPAKQNVDEENDVLMSKEEYFAMLDKRIANAKAGNVIEYTSELEHELFG